VVVVVVDSVFVVVVVVVVVCVEVEVVVVVSEVSVTHPTKANANTDRVIKRNKRLCFMISLLYLESELLYDLPSKQGFFVAVDKLVA